MSSVMVMLVVSLFIPAVRLTDLWKLNCLPTVGIFAETTVIKCSFKGINDINIIAVFLRKANESDPFFTQQKLQTLGDQRFSLENIKIGPSLQISNTKFSDEGKYLYRVVTDSGEKEIEFSIIVTAKYKDPVTSTWPERIADGDPVSLYCNATDGYPEGFIHWFDRSGYNWTKNADLTKTPNGINDVKSVAMSSKLTFKSINLGLAPFTCNIYNSKYVQVGENTLEITSTLIDVSEVSSGSNTTNIVAGVMVIGSLTVGLLFALLIFKRRKIIRYDQASECDQEKGECST